MDSSRSSANWVNLKQKKWRGSKNCCLCGVEKTTDHVFSTVVLQKLCGDASRKPWGGRACQIVFRTSINFFKVGYLAL